MRKPDSKNPKNLIEKLDGYSVPDTEAYWANFEKALDRDRAKAAQRIRYRAAFVSILIVLAAALFMLTRPVRESQKEQTKNTISSPANKGSIVRGGENLEENKSYNQTSNPPGDAAANHTQHPGVQRRNREKVAGLKFGLVPSEKHVVNPSASAHDDRIANDEKPGTQKDFHAAPKDEELLAEAKSQTRFLDSFIEMTLNPYRNAGTNPLTQAKQKQKVNGLRAETGLTAGFLWTIPTYPAADAPFIPKAGIKAGIYREQRLTNRLSLLAEPCMVYRWGANMEKSSVQNRYFLKHEIIETRVTTRGILSLEVPVSLVVNLNNRHAISGGVLGSFLINTVSQVSKSEQSGNNTTSEPGKTAWNYKAGFAKTSYGLCAGYIYRKNDQISLTGVYTLILSDALKPGYYAASSSMISVLQLGLRYKILSK